jgi:hypothetical protein
MGLRRRLVAYLSRPSKIFAVAQNNGSANASVMN